MYRLLKLNNTNIRSYSKVSLNNFSENSDLTLGDGKCSLCKRLNTFSTVSIRKQSTITNINPTIQSKKHKKRQNRKYAELLVVRENTSSTQEKATVKRLSSNDLKLLANTNLNLSELYKLKALNKNSKVIEEHTYNNLTVIDNLPGTSKSDFLINFEKNEDNHTITYNIPPLTPPLHIKASLGTNTEEIISDSHDILIPEIVENDIPPVKKDLAFQPEEIEEHTEIEEVKTNIEKRHKVVPNRKYHQEIINKTLAGYIETCSHIKHPQKGLNAVLFHRHREKVSRNFYPLKYINVYNALLKGFASKGDFEKIEEVVGYINEVGLKMNLQSYIAIFECLGRINIDNNHLKDIRIFARDALEKNITFDKMLSEGTFLNDERSLLLKAIMAHDPKFVPNISKPILQYKNHLVDHLNCEEQLKELHIEYKENGGIFKPSKMKEQINKQLKLETEGYITIKSVDVKENPSEDIIRYREVLKEHYNIWEENAIKAFSRDLLALRAQRSFLNFEPYLRCIPTKEYVRIIVDEAQKIAHGSETYSPTVGMLYKDLGNQVYARFKVLKKQKTRVIDKMLAIHTDYCTDYASSHGKLDILPKGEVLLNTRQKWQWTQYKHANSGATLDMDHQEWVPSTLVFIGKFLYHIIMHDLKIDVNSMNRQSKHRNFLPAFYTIFRSQARIVKEEVKPHPVLSKLYRASVPETLKFPAYEVPMICPPVPWISTEVGGYLVSPCHMIRLPALASAQRDRLRDAPPEQLYPSLDALNQLSSVPWKVHEELLDVILKVFNNGGSSKLDVPEPPSSLAPPEQVTVDMEKSQRFQLFRQKLQYRRKKAEMYSLWCDCLYRLSLANHFRKDIFWLPHNMDFRGRVYPVPPHLNHLGSDLARSMLVFAEKRPLGPEGLNWLKLHLINLTGLKKRDPVSERLKYADEIMDSILDSADKPLDGNQWWAQSDEPWQTLSCCMEIAKAIRSGNPEKFESNFPIHQDGSCNGLQHYAALGRDASGAFSVNLSPADVPQDVYSAVVGLVEEQRWKDAENGIEIAKVLDGFVKRKVIKQTVMTTVYGVTRFGARLQIARQLKDIDNFPKDSVWAASAYLTTKTFESLRTMFTSTREIQDWFTDCARLISSVGGQHVEWITPLGLPIVQPYFKYKKNTMPFYDTFSLDKYEKPNVMKQKNAFPPNFIHSLDSSHMMLTSLHCERKGITFVSVHDCYWTHPSTVHIMNKICREQFVALHSEPILENLSMFLTDKYSYDDTEFAEDGSVVELSKKKLNRILTQLPKTGDFNIENVLDSVYFFS